MNVYTYLIYKGDGGIVIAESKADALEKLHWRYGKDIEVLVTSVADLEEGVHRIRSYNEGK